MRESSSAVRTLVDVPLTPGSDCSCSAAKDGGTSDDTHRSRYVVQLGIVNDEGARKFTVAWN